MRFDIIKCHTSYNEKGDFIVTSFDNKKDVDNFFHNNIDKTNYYYLCFDKKSDKCYRRKNRKNILDRLVSIYGKNPINNDDYDSIKKIKKIFLKRKYTLSNKIYKNYT